MDLQSKEVTVMGLGLHGGALGTIAWLVSRGAQIRVTDTKTEAELAESVAAARELGVRDFYLGGHRAEDFREVDMVIRNPGVRRDSRWLAMAASKGITIEMDSSLFFEYSPTADIIGVTGSKGKTTTARAIEAVLSYGGEDVVAVGVDGVSPLGVLAGGKIDAGTTVVFELSSWRLEALAQRNISPKVAVVTSIYKEHLNTYESFSEYIETKKAIWKGQDEAGVVLLNADDPEIASWEGEPAGKVYWFGLHDIEDMKGMFGRDGKIWARDTKELEIMPLGELPAQSEHGEHERRNMLSALWIGLRRGMSVEDVRAGMATFKPLPHRLELVAEVDGVRYINDSAATMPDASIAALRSFPDDLIVLIAGGSDKALEFDEWAGVVAGSNVRGLVWLPGTATERMRAAVAEVGGPAGAVADSMEGAVAMARALAQPGDVVLLSPGATSFGLFLHEFDRGEMFRAAVSDE